ncbi:Vta1p NDAI_0J02120 [Naumovozyma dairenensis CBS 421]|uniref:Vta1 C-terminal domain-containing protein n=1 Tax=Naumovozyma dairenensis (strain ATCC 10597 / BCRC 20456 / CBS 421 / NBRC 0211 / NRRL Y-12639) TaxID=1071378 RepID=G0WH26_NAUDC|nr:hypothetical protein NDAI_0J02120 [Naumovozyma dairenensis CBS 421]CCD27104.1 hypothetical protein NDAI_0J02120 [Naumovozyma dairenensis CBS 421]
MMNQLIRLKLTSLDFERAGLSIISYYLRLYSIELILSNNEGERSRELTELATSLLDQVEIFKNETKRWDDDADDEKKHEQENPLYVLIHDQQKAKVYVLNFTMSLYNEKLKEIQAQNGSGNSTTATTSSSNNNDLKRGLWCCIDLFSCVLHLWKQELSEDVCVALRKRIKYCKVCLNNMKQLDYSDFVEDEEETKDKVTDDDIDKLLTELKAQEEVEEENLRASNDETKLEDDKKDINLQEEKDGEVSPEDDNGFAVKKDDAKPPVHGEEDEETHLQAQNAKTANLPEDAKKANVKEEEEDVNQDLKNESIPSFIDSDDSDEHYQDTSESPEELKREAKKKQVTSAVPSKSYSQAELNKMMDSSAKIEQVQRLAKYAISALNYEDIPTAKDELIKALDLLNTL